MPANARETGFNEMAEALKRPGGYCEA